MDCPGNAMRVRPMAVESGQCVLRARDRSLPDMEGTRASETMIRAVVVSIGRAVRGATPPSLPLRRPGAAEGALRGLSPVGRLR